jgi:uncharacterized membrane protein YeiH
VIPLWADLLAVGLGGVQGALFASGFVGQRRLDLLGVVIVGTVMGMGGGIIRDLLLNVTPRRSRATGTYHRRRAGSSACCWPTSSSASTR